MKSKEKILSNLSDAIDELKNQKKMIQELDNSDEHLIYRLLRKSDKVKKYINDQFEDIQEIKSILNIK